MVALTLDLARPFAMLWIIVQAYRVSGEREEEVTSFSPLFCKLRSKTPVTDLLSEPAELSCEPGSWGKVPTGRRMPRSVGGSGSLHPHMLLFAYGLRQQTQRQFVIDVIREPETHAHSRVFEHLL